MKKLKIFTIDEIHKSMVTHEFKKPPGMGSKMRPAKAEAEGYTAPKRTGHPSEPKNVGQAFSINRAKGPEEAKRYEKRMRRAKAEEKKSDIQAYGRPIE